MMTINLPQLAAAVLYAVLGIIIFIGAFKVAEKLLPFNLVKELVEDDNIAVGVLMAAIIIGLALIIASAIHG
jgi:putative membrane protein